jgi:hypothetical protein
MQSSVVCLQEPLEKKTTLPSRSQHTAMRLKKKIERKRYPKDNSTHPSTSIFPERRGVSHEYNALP